MGNFTWLLGVAACLILMGQQPARPPEARGRFLLAALLAAAAFLRPELGWLGTLGFVQLLPLMFVQARLPYAHPHLLTWIRLSCFTPALRHHLQLAWLETYLLRHGTPPARAVSPLDALVAPLAAGRPLEALRGAHGLNVPPEWSRAYHAYLSWALSDTGQPLEEPWRSLLEGEPLQAQRAARRLGLEGRFWTGRALFLEGQRARDAQALQQGAQLMLSDLRPGRELFAWRLHEASKLLAPFGIDPRARLLERHRFPVATLGLLLLIFVFFGWEILESGGLGPGALSLGGGFSLEALLALGANANVITVQEGQWWRLVTSTLLHGGLLHIGLNAFYLWTIGSALERSIGPGMLVFAFALTGVVGSAASALLGAPNVLSVGASGALFGWVGLLSTVGEGNVAQRLGRLGRAAPSLFLMLFIGFLIPNVDVWAHVGGLLAGLLLGLSYRRPSARERQVFGVLGALTLAWGIVSLLLWRGSL